MKKTMNLRIYTLSLLAIAILSFIPVSTIAGSWNGWIYQDPYPTSVNLFDVKFVTPMKGWITGKYGTILYTEDGGENWEAQESGIEEDIMRVAFVNDKMGWAAGERGTIIHTADGGKKWVKQFNIKALPTKIFFISEKEGWVTGSNPMGVVYTTKDGGKTWQKLETGINRAISSVHFINLQMGWILAGEEVYRTADGGKKWVKSKLPISEPSHPQSVGKFPGGVAMGEGLGFDWRFGDIIFTNEKQGWTAISRWIFYSEDGGKTWNIQYDTGNLPVAHISFSDEQIGCASGSSIYCTEDGGKTWQERLKLSPNHNKELGGISLTSQSAGWATGNSGLILETKDRGKSWKSVLKIDMCGNRLELSSSQKTRWLWATWLPDICRTDDEGQTWLKLEVGIKLIDLFFVDDSVGWALGSFEEDEGRNKRIYRVIKRTTDGGKTWATQLKEVITGKLSFYDIDLFAVHFVNHEIGWVVGDEGTILYTKDGGNRWERQQSGTTLNLFRVYFVDAKKGVAIGDRGVALGEDREEDEKAKGVILFTEDGGNHWRIVWERMHVLMSVLFFSDKNTAWATAKTLKGTLLLYSEDRGKTWSEKKLKNIPIRNLYFLDRNRGVLFLTKNMLLVTENGGKTWAKMRKPLKKYPWHVSELFEKQATK